MRPAFDEKSVRFVLIEPRYAGNVGAAARALKNLGYSRLVLVNPAFDLRDRQAWTMAVEARDILQRAQIAQTLDEALTGAQSVVGATARRGRYRRPHWRLDALAPEMARMAAGGELAVIFGREDRGVVDTDLDRCTHLIYLPASERYTSFNLAQAVLLVGYELRLARIAPAERRDWEPAGEHGEREAMFRHLQEALLAIGFISDDTMETIMRRLRRMLGRAEMTADEIKLLRGLARQTLWAAGRADPGAEPAASGEGEDPGG